MYYRFLFSILIFAIISKTSLGYAAPRDFDGDGKTDLLLLSYPYNENETGVRFYWHVLGSRDGEYSVTQWGANDYNSGGYIDTTAQGDYDGDGKVDYAVWRCPQINPWPDVGSQCYLYILFTTTFNFSVIPWGLSPSQTTYDYPLLGDFDGDGKRDFGIARTSSSAGMVWWIMQSRGGIRVERFGLVDDKPRPADYDGDGKTDLAIVRRTGSQLTWYIEKSSDHTWIVTTFGQSSGDQWVGGDFDGDGKADIAMVRSSGDFPDFVWRWIRSSDGRLDSVQWGAPGIDSATAGDYDGDRITDIAIYRPDFNCEGQGHFWIRGSTSGTQVVPFGNCHTQRPASGNQAPAPPDIENYPGPEEYQKLYQR